MKRSTEGLLLVTNKADETLSIVDPEEGQEITTVPVGGTTAHEVAASRDGRFAWVPIYGDSGVGLPGSNGRTINVIDLHSRKIAASLDLGRPSRPHCAVFGPRDGRLYVTSELTNSIVIVNPIERKIVDSTPTGAPESHMMVISSDGKRAYTSNVGVGTVSAIDISERRVIAVIPISRIAQRIGISTDDRWVFTSDQTDPNLAVIDTKKNEVAMRIPLNDVGYGVAPTLDGRYLLVAQPYSGSVSVVDLESMKVQRTIKVRPEPQEVLVRPDNLVAYVSCDASKQVAAIDLSTWKVQRFIEVGGGADGLSWTSTNHR